MEAGRAVVVNVRTDSTLIGWAEARGLYEYVGRKYEWGNPYPLGECGTRAEVLRLFAENYWPFRTHLHREAAGLKGKALGCHCAPEACHADWLAAQANGGPWPDPPASGPSGNGAAAGGGKRQRARGRQA
jgi:hypothetical protein